MKHILLTGSGGFIGQHLKNILSKYYILWCPRSYELDLRDEVSLDNYLKSHPTDFIVHSASAGVRILSSDTMASVAKPNLEMFNNLARLGIPMITFGSGAEYDKSRPLVKVREEEFGNHIPKDPYGYSKYLISKKIEKLSHVLNLRIFGIYGEGEHPSRVTSYIITRLLNKQPIILNQNVVFDFIYIEDFCQIVLYFIENLPNSKFINVTPTRSIEIIDLARIVNQFGEFQSDIIVKWSGNGNEYTGSNSRLMQYINGFKFTNYEQGLETIYKGAIK